MEDFLGSKTYQKDDIRIRVNVQYADKRLSMSATVYENYSDVGGGQCYEQLLEDFPESAPLVEIWLRWHLNDLRAGDPLQESYLRALGLMGFQRTSYETICSALDKAGLLVHDGYKYGSEWKFESVPHSVLRELKSMIKELKI